MLTEELQALVSRPEFTFLAIDLMDAVSKGYSVAEITWEPCTSRPCPNDVAAHRE